MPDLAYVACVVAAWLILAACVWVCEECER